MKLEAGINGDPLCPLPPASAPQISNTITSSTPVNIYPQPFKPSARLYSYTFYEINNTHKITNIHVAAELVYDEEKDTLVEKWNGMF